MSFSRPLAPKRNNSASHPGRAEFFFHQRQPFDGLLRSADSTCGFESDCHSGFLRIFADAARHHEADRQRRIRRFFPGRGFDEICARHHGDNAGPGHVSQGQEVAGSENHFHVRRTTRLFECRDLVVERLPLAAEDVGARDHHINIVRSRLDRSPNLRHALGKR